MSTQIVPQIIGLHVNKLVCVYTHTHTCVCVCIYSISPKEQRPRIWGGGPVFKKEIWPTLQWHNSKWWSLHNIPLLHEHLLYEWALGKNI